jgi:hypothetical protein
MAKRRIGAVVFLLFAIVFAVVFVRTNATAGAYDAAPACASPGVIDTSGCRWTVDAPVVGARKTRAARASSAYLTVDLPSLGPTEVLLASTSDVYDRAAKAVGATLRATGWHRDVVTLSDTNREVDAADAPRGNAHFSFALATCALLVAILLALPANILARRIAAGFALTALVALIMTGVAPHQPLIFDYGIAAITIGSVALLILAITALTRLRHAR